MALFRNLEDTRMVHPIPQRKLLPGRAALGSALLVLVTFAPRAPAQYTWNNPTGGNWSVGSNWAGGTAPTPGATTALTFGTAATQSATYTAANDIGAAGAAFDLNALTVNNTAGTVTVAGNPLTLNQTGGRVNVTENVYVGDAAGSAGTLTVTGVGTVLDVTIGGQSGRIGVGNNGTGTLNVAAGGVVNSLRVFVARLGGGAGDAVVDGAGSTLNASVQLLIGNNGVGTLTVRNGGAVTAAGFVNMANGDLGNGAITVTGAGSALTAGTPTAAGTLTTGAFGTGALNVQGGGQVTVNGDAFAADFSVNARGTVTVTDAGSLLRVTGQLSLGGVSNVVGGTATLNVGSGGTVAVAGRAAVYGGGTVNLNAGGVLSLGSLADGSATSIGSVHLAAGTTLTLTAGGTTFSGVISGAGGLAMSGPGAQALAGANTYTGTTTVSAGTLSLTGGGSFAASPRITVGTAAGSTAVLDVSGVTGGANFGNGGFALAPGQTLAGHGVVVGPVTITSGSAVAPGTGVGALHVAGMTWQGGGRYDFEFAGTSGGLVSGTGALDLGALGGGNRFTINIASTGPPQPLTFAIATFAGGIAGFGPSEFDFTGSFTGTPSITQDGSSLVLTFTPVPEPAHALLPCVAVVAAAGCRRHRRQAVPAVPVHPSRRGCSTDPWDGPAR
jgi:T5SS/PEP-CTERM-associated repeat protein/autotransporter-associated beta strand protein